MLKKLVKILLGCFIGLMLVTFVEGFLEDDTEETVEVSTTEETDNNEDDYTFTPNTDIKKVPDGQLTSDDIDEEDPFPEYSDINLDNRYSEGDKVKFSGTISAIGTNSIEFVNKDTVNMVTTTIYMESDVDLNKYLSEYSIGDTVSVCGIVNEDNTNKMGDTLIRDIYMTLTHVGLDEVK